MSACPVCSQPAPEGSRFCPSCATPLDGALPTQTSVPTNGGMTSAGTRGGTVPARTSDGSRPTLDEVRFLPGTMLESRYRVVGLIGRGGMGEVYRADDLKLGQPVALKFLPRELEHRHDRLERFLNEIKLSRQVSHPAVCRVYDVGETDGQHYLSMEYVDGEDLASLLRRIGRLPRDKSIEIARQLCAGLAAAHEQGILHRDLKPANVLIDGRGRVKITDFGLAGLAETIHGKELQAGTPGYMSPEQIAGSEVSVKSDIYALGLVLYEMFTGKQAYQADTYAKLSKLQQTTTPTTPSTVIDGFDPAVERLILRCLEKKSEKRPPSALAVAAALPGGDPLAAALAAGETPSPELVAAAGERVVVPRWLPWTCLVAVVVGLPLVIALSDRVMLYRQVPLEIPPQVLRATAEQILQETGHEGNASNVAQGFSYNNDYLRYLGRTIEASQWSDALPRAPGAVYYWYRQSPNRLRRLDALSDRTSLADPPMTVPGMASVALDTRGRLLGLTRVPTEEDLADATEREETAPAVAAAAAESSSTLDWSGLFRRAGLEPQQLTRVPPETVPPIYADDRRAWTGSYPDRPGEPLRVEAAAAGGRLVSFRISGPWDDEPTAGGPGIVQLFALVANLLVMGLVVVAAVMARRNVHRGRGDRKGALRLALYFMVWHMLMRVVAADYQAVDQAVSRLFVHLGIGVMVAAAIWVIYLALEPLVRRLWPDTLVSWARLLEGKFRDPLVGRDLVLGAALSIALVALDRVTSLAPSWVGMPIQYERPALWVLFGGHYTLAAILQFQVTLFVVMGSLLALVLFRAMLRRTWAAFLVTSIFIGGLLGAQSTSPVQLVFVVIFWMALMAMLMRFGLLAAAVALYLHAPLAHMATTGDLGAWYGQVTVGSILLVVAVALYGFVTAFGGRSMFGDVEFEEA